MPNRISDKDLRRAGNEVKKFGRHVDRALNTAANSIKRGSIGPNPTASGSGTGMTGNERANHKYLDKVKTRSGKIRYIYDVNTASMTNKTTEMAKKGQAAYNLKKAQQASPSRNTGRPASMNTPMYKASTAVKDLVDNASRTIDQGLNFVKKLFGG